MLCRLITKINTYEDPHMYTQLYKNTIDNAKSENRNKHTDIYYESHHIVPDFMFKNRSRKGPCGHLDGNPDSVDNIVLLTFREHLMCHYYLYEIYKDTRYGYSAGSSLQFFFVKATGNHVRSRSLSEVDETFLQEMDHLRLLGISSISKARLGKMPVVDAITRKSIGSVDIHHPKILSGEWIHHSKGKPSPNSGRNQQGKNNSNYKEMTNYRELRLFECVNKSVEDGYLVKNLLEMNIKSEFIEFSKISTAWVKNNYGNIQCLVDKVNIAFDSEIKYNPYHRSKKQRQIASDTTKATCWVTDSLSNNKISKSELVSFLAENPSWKHGRT
jgi:hypothetical protein